MEKRLYSPQATSFDKAKWDSLITLYEGFCKRFPEDSLVPGYTFNAANISMNSGNGQKAWHFSRRSSTNTRTTGKLRFACFLRVCL